MTFRTSKKRLRAWMGDRLPQVRIQFQFRVSPAACRRARAKAKLRARVLEVGYELGVWNPESFEDFIREERRVQGVWKALRRQYLNWKGGETL